MSKKITIKIEIENEEYADTLIFALVRQGYEVYLQDDRFICFDIPEEEIEIKEK